MIATGGKEEVGKDFWMWVCSRWVCSPQARSQTDLYGEDDSWLNERTIQARYHCHIQGTDIREEGGICQGDEGWEGC